MAKNNCALLKEIDYYTRLLENYEKSKQEKIKCSFEKLYPESSILPSSGSTNFRQPAANVYKKIRYEITHSNSNSKRTTFEPIHIRNVLNTSMQKQNVSVKNKIISHHNNGSYCSSAFSSSVSSQKSDLSVSVDVLPNRTVICNSDSNKYDKIVSKETNKRKVVMKNPAENKICPAKSSSQQLMNEIMAVTKQLKEKASEDFHVQSKSRFTSNSKIGGNVVSKRNFEPQPKYCDMYCINSFKKLNSDKNLSKDVTSVKKETKSSLEKANDKCPIGSCTISSSVFVVKAEPVSTVCNGCHDIKCIFHTKEEDEVSAPYDLKPQKGNILLDKDKSVVNLALVDRKYVTDLKTPYNKKKISTPVPSGLPVVRKLNYSSTKKKFIARKKFLNSTYKVINKTPLPINSIKCERKIPKYNLKGGPVKKSELQKSKYRLINNSQTSCNVARKKNSFSQLQSLTSPKTVRPVKPMKVKLGSYKLVNNNRLTDSKEEILRTKLQSKSMSKNTPIQKYRKSLKSRHKIINSCGRTSMNLSTKILSSKAKIPHQNILNSKYKVVNRSGLNKSLKGTKLNSPFKLKYDSKDIPAFHAINKNLLTANRPSTAPCNVKSLLLKRIYKSKNTIINKNANPIYQTARMIKTKYFTVNKRSTWQKNSIPPRNFIKAKITKGHNLSYNYYPGRLTASRKVVYNHSFHHGRYNSSHARGFPRKILNERIFNQKRKFEKIGYKNSPLVVIRGQKYLIGSSGNTLKKLQRKNSAYNTKTAKRNVAYRKTYATSIIPNAVKIETPISKTLASRVLHRSINRVVTASMKKKVCKVNTYCMFYNRFGRCNKGVKCLYIHDPSKIAVCTRFLRGTCKIDGCPFSHEICPGKMAICSFFLLDSCNKADCPYRHEKLSSDSELCKPFVQGYCADGKKCQKAHILVCPQYIQGSCAKGKDCAFPHPPPKIKKNLQTETVENVKESEEILLERVSRYFQSCTKESTTEGSCNNLVFQRKQNFPEQPSFIPLSNTPMTSRLLQVPKQPSFIPLCISDDGVL